MKRLAAIAALAIAAALASTELAYWIGFRASAKESGEGSCAVLVLGYPSEADGRPHPVQRLRVEAGVAAYRAHACSRIVLSGGAVRNRHVEAVSMARVARELGVPAGDVVIEDRAHNTWENVGCGAPHLAGFDRVFVASDSLHAHRGRRYLCRQQPDLCDRAFAVGGYSPLSLVWWKVPSALYELRAWIRDVTVYEREGAKSSPPCPGEGG